LGGESVGGGGGGGEEQKVSSVQLHRVQILYGPPPSPHSNSTSSLTC